MKKIIDIKLDYIENWLLNNLFLVLLLSIWWILILYWFPIITNYELYIDGKMKQIRLLDLKFTIWAVWAIFIFWYWYKKYERDKELELISNYNIEKDINKIVIDWHTKRILYQKKYLKEYLWEIIEDNYFLSFFQKMGIVWKLGIISNEYEIIEDLALNNWLVINNLINYNETKLYFQDITNTILNQIDSQISFSEKYDSWNTKIIYLKILKTYIK